MAHSEIVEKFLTASSQFSPAQAGHEREGVEIVYVEVIGRIENGS